MSLRTAAATSNLSGFLSGCHVRSSSRHCFARSSFDSMDCSLVSFCNASILASSTSLDSLGALRASFMPAKPFFRRLRLRLLLEELLEELLLLLERLLEREPLFDFLFLRLFRFLEELLEELLLLLERLLEREPLFDFL